jgi:hypothetical protein
MRSETEQRQGRAEAETLALAWRKGAEYSTENEARTATVELQVELTTGTASVALVVHYSAPLALPPVASSVHWFRASHRPWSHDFVPAARHSPESMR